MSQRKGRGSILLLAGAIAMALPAVTQAQAPPAPVTARQQFDIPAGSLADALSRFSEQSGVQVLYEPDLVEGRRVAAFRGAATARDALRRLLDNSGLVYEFVSGNTAVLRPALPVTPPPRPEQRNDKAPGVTEGEEATELEPIVVTGTRIRGVAPDSSPLIVYEREDIERTGASTVEQLIRKIPQNYSLVDGETFYNNGSDTSALSNGARGSAINLRGLGVGSTLVLLNGRRLAPSGTDGSFVDVSVIPLSAIDRVEVLTDGASALYGADAVAGVVNFVLRKDYEGTETSLRYGDSTRGGAAERSISQTLGHAWRSGNAVLVYEYFDQTALDAADREFVPDQGGPFVILPGQERHSVLASFRQELGPATEMFGDAVYSRREFTQPQTLAGFDIFVEDHGTAEGVSGSFGLAHDLFDDWRGEIVGGYSSMEQQREGFSNTAGVVAPFFFETTTEIYSADLKADGSVFAAPGGQARASFGAAGRRERFRRTTSDFERDVISAYGELFVPLVGSFNAKPWAKRLELTVAGRYDRYSDAGSSVDPKIGVLWSPAKGLNLRSTYGSSYRAPPLTQLHGPQTYQVQAFPDPDAADGSTVSLYQADIGNPGLRPETSTSFTAGFDFRPPAISGLSVSATYFRIDFEDRIARPIPPGELSNVYFMKDTLSPFINFSPNPEEIARIFAEEVVENPGGFSPEDIEAFVTLNLQNLASTKTSGVDLSVDYAFASGADQFTFFLSGSRLFRQDFKNTVTTPAISRLNKVYQPVDLRLRGGMYWSRGRLASSLAINYTDSYKNQLVDPAERIGSWITADWQLSYQFGATALRGVSITLDVQNLTDEGPPRISEETNRFFNLGFDSTNASPRGRFVSLQLRRLW